MIKFTPYFYRFKEMLLDKNIPIEFRAKFIIEKGLTSCWRKMYNHNMYTDDTVQNNLYGRFWESSLAWKLRKVSIRDVGSILDMDLKHPEISPSDLATALILWGRGPAIVKKLLELTTDVPEKDEFMNLLNEAKKWKKEKKSLPEEQVWFMR